ncbi:MAG TPA: transcriptional repressor [Candidatus Mediterraneibacter guildfordensis]|uniref:Transcriptional repressor n=1 Tax=Candidatus Mediterraneibacter quadrami TaxID=2838684 RepID=A0A9D2RDK9_9FIRM|nr:transcriptional repressor [Candidatus Mediterraneibacter guildfordensis]HJD41426.1 transcriptional repressor [Candidatus Mediterraneibacter quadrami]
MEQKNTEKLLKEKLREKGLKVTQQRILVLSALEQNSGAHMTAEEICELVSQEYPEIGLATVYRTLQLLLDMQLVDRINLDDGCVRYEIGHLLKGSEKHNHHHLICRSCGKVIPFDGDLLEGLEQHIEETAGFHVLDHEVKFYGLCSECMKTQKSMEVFTG